MIYMHKFMRNRFQLNRRENLQRKITGKFDWMVSGDNRFPVSGDDRTDVIVGVPGYLGGPHGSLLMNDTA